MSEIVTSMKIVACAIGLMLGAKWVVYGFLDGPLWHGAVGFAAMVIALSWMVNIDAASSNEVPK